MVRKGYIVLAAVLLLFGTSCRPRVSVSTGTAQHNDLIPPIEGFTIAQCKCVVSMSNCAIIHRGEVTHSFMCYLTEEPGGWRVFAVTRGVASNPGLEVPGTVNYIIIGVRPWWPFW